MADQHERDMPGEKKISTHARRKDSHILSYMDDGYYEVDLNGKFFFANNALLKIFGYKDSKIYAMTFASLADEKTKKKLNKMFATVLQTREIIKDITCQFYNKKSKRVFGEMSICPAVNNKGHVIGFTGLVKDQTKMRVLEQDLAINIEGLDRMITSRTLEMKEEIEQKQYIKTINTALFSISKAINTTKNLDELYPIIHHHLNDIIQMDHFYIGILNLQKDTIHIEYRIDQGIGPLKDMKMVALHNTLVGQVLNENKPLLLDKNALIESRWSVQKFGPIPEKWLGIPLASQTRMIGIMIAYSTTDPDCFTKDDFQMLISVSSQVGFAIERRQILDELNASEEKYRQLVETTTAGYWQLDKGGVTKGLNPALCKMLGYSKKQIMGKNFTDFVDDQSKDILKTQFENRQNTKDRQYELVLKKKNKQLLYVKIDATSMFSDDGLFQGSFAVVADITEQKKAEENLLNETRRANDMAQAAQSANKAKSQFLANMSHEIRTPLNGVLGMAELLMEGRLENDQKSLVEIISEEADSLMIIINTILDFSKIEAGKMDIEEIPFDLRKMFEDFSSSIAVQAGKKGLDFLSYLDPGIPSALKGDPGRLRQIFMNLVGNALKFTKKGEIFISGKMVSQTAKKVVVWFEVTDTGIGIPKEKQQMVFDSFSQVDGSTTRKFGGTGLGTTISKQLLEMMGGKIGLESIEGKGSKFWFILGFNKQGPDRVEKNSLKTDLAGIRVLMVENNKTHQYILSKYLQALGCISIHAKDSTRAFEHLEKASHGIDIILIDTGLPGKNGFEFAQQIRQTDQFKALPVILMTATGKPGDGKRCRKIGINGYLSKPIRKIDLQMTIAQVLGMIDQPVEHEQQLVTRHYIEELKKKNIRILVVEDYPTNQQVAVRHLSHAGFDVTLAENGLQAVALFKKTKFDLIFMDIQMPEMDGYEATQKIRQIEARISKDLKKQCHVPIIATTAHAMKGYKDKCLQARMDDYLKKPLKRRQLIEMVEKWLVPDPGHLYPLLPKDPPKIFGRPIDMGQALEEFDNDQQFFNEVYEGFVSEVDRQLGMIRNAIKENDFNTIEKQSHSIKGGAANLIARDLSKAASDLEKIGRAKTADGLDDALDRLEAAYKCLVQYVGLT